jgi:hypothetical protein
MLRPVPYAAMLRKRFDRPRRNRGCYF